MISLTLPIPPSLNNMFGNKKVGKGRYKTKPYTDWIDRALIAIRNAGVTPEKKIKFFKLVIFLPAKMRGDGDNRPKGIFDILKRAKIIVDDRYCRGSTWDFRDDIPIDFCVIELTPIEGK